MKWQLYYDDGSIWNYKQGFPPSEKAWGIITVLQQRADGAGSYRLMGQADYYLYDGDSWIITDLVGLIDNLVHNFDNIKGVAIGRMIGDDRYKQIADQAKLDGENRILDKE